LFQMGYLTIQQEENLDGRLKNQAKERSTSYRLVAVGELAVNCL